MFSQVPVIPRLVFLSLPSSLTHCTVISHTYCILIINSSSFCYKGIKQIFLLNSHFPTRLEITDSRPPPSLCKHKRMCCCAGTSCHLLSGCWDLFIFWWTGILRTCGPCQVFRYQLKKPRWKECLALQHRECPTMHHIFLIDICFNKHLPPKAMAFQISFRLEPCSYPAVSFTRRQSPHH